MGDAVGPLLSSIMPARTQGQSGTERRRREENIRGGKPRQVVSHRRQSRRAGNESELENVREVKRDEAEIRKPKSGRFMSKEQVGLGNIENMNRFKNPGLCDVDII